MTEIELNEKLKEIERERCNALPCQPNRRTGKAYRRQMHIKKNDDLLRIVIRHYVPHAGYVDWDFDGQTLKVSRSIDQDEVSDLNSDISFTKRLFVIFKRV